MLLTEKYLMDNFEMTGSDLEECRTLITEIAENTTFEKISSAALNVYSFTSDSTNEKMRFYKFNPDELPSDVPEKSILRHRYALSKVGLSKWDLDFMIDEIENITKLAFCDNSKANNNFYFASENVLTSMEPFGLRGSFLATPSFERDQLIARQFKEDKAVTLVMRNFKKTKMIDGNEENKTIKKVFAIRSTKYTEMPQLEVFHIIDKIIDEEIFGKVKCLRWIVNHFLTQIDLEFPDKAEEICKAYGLPNVFVPGIRIVTSDTGNSSFKITGTWRVKNSLTLTNEVSKRHSGEINISEIIEDVDKEIFAEYVKIPEALCDLMLKNITPVTLDLSNSKDVKKNKELMEDIIKSTLKELNIVKAIGKKNEMALRDLLLEEIDPSISYTAYDVAMQILTIPERLEGLTDASLNALAKAISKAPFCTYESKDSSLFLV